MKASAIRLATLSVHSSVICGGGSVYENVRELIRESASQWATVSVDTSTKDSAGSAATAWANQLARASAFASVNQLVSEQIVGQCRRTFIPFEWVEC